MKAKIQIALALLFAFTLASYAEVTARNGIGDWNLVSIGGFTFAKALSIDLMPTNAPKAGVRYSIRCQVIYEDHDIPSPRTDEEFGLLLETGELLNEWVGELIAQKYMGMEFEDLFARYYSKNLADEVNSLFPIYVKEKIEAMESGNRPNIKTVTVQVEAEGEFRNELVKYLEQRANVPQRT